MNLQELRTNPRVVPWSLPQASLFAKLCHQRRCPVTHSLTWKIGNSFTINIRTEHGRSEIQNTKLTLMCVNCFYGPTHKGVPLTYLRSNPYSHRRSHSIVAVPMTKMYHDKNVGTRYLVFNCLVPASGQNHRIFDLLWRDHNAQEHVFLITWTRSKQADLALQPVRIFSQRTCYM